MCDVSVLIVDDDESVRLMLPTYFADTPVAVVAVACSAGQVLDIVRTRSIDVVLADIRMPEMSGIELIRELAARGKRPRVVAMTSFDDDEYVVEALRAGAAGVILKSAERQVIVHAVTEAHAGRTVVASDLAGRLSTYLAPVRPAPRQRLTQREGEVLDLLIDGMSNPEIAEAIGVTPAAVKKHLGSLMVKFGVSTRLQLVVAALRPRPVVGVDKLT